MGSTFGNLRPNQLIIFVCVHVGNPPLDNMPKMERLITAKVAYRASFNAFEAPYLVSRLRVGIVPRAVAPRLTQARDTDRATALAGVPSPLPHLSRYRPVAYLHYRAQQAIRVSNKRNINPGALSHHPVRANIDP